MVAASRATPVRVFLVALAAALAVCIWWVFLSPVCVPIAADQLPVFESVRTLEQRAERGEPFERRGGRWHICKSRFVRAFTF